MSTRGDLTIVRDGTTGSTPINCGSTNTYYTKYFPLKYGLYFGIWLKATATAGTPNLKITLEQSAIEPAVEIAAADGNWVVGDGVSDIYSNLNDSIAHVKSFSPAIMKYGRLKIEGLGANPASTTLDARVFIQEIVA